MLGDEGMSAASSPLPSAPATQLRIGNHRVNPDSGSPSLTRQVAKLPRPRCLIGDTGCGHDIVAQRWVVDSEAICLIPVDVPPHFSGVGGCMTAKMKLSLVRQALQAVVEPYVLPATPDVLSIGRRCVRMGWSFWSPHGLNDLSFASRKARASPCTLM